MPLPPLEVSRTYLWDELASLFSFKANYLGVAGGMVSRPEHNALLLITHPGGGRSFDYEDYWDGGDLIYTGRGKTGDQSLKGPNGDVVENRRHLLVFENVGSRVLRFLGESVCIKHWTARGAGADGAERLIYRFQLSFGRGETEPALPTTVPAPPKPKRPRHLSTRPFDPSQSVGGLTDRGQRASLEETLARKEKAFRGHHQILVVLHEFLTSGGWEHIEEMPSGVDLWAVRQGGPRVIFEGKTITVTNEVHQCRSGLAQLLEYQFFYGEPEDELCLVVDQPIADARVRFLESAGVAIASTAEGRVRSVGVRGTRVLGIE
jgi:hypothetical protein